MKHVVCIRILALTICIGLGILVFFAPIVAAIVFVGCVTFVAIIVGKEQGFWKGLALFIKEILFGW